ncbi:MAG: hypothetical protein HY268_34035 [Deltaproteobacteria bacterium]|nr:hypothetical protein [Deltaproteobacteria bacterium]
MNTPQKGLTELQEQIIDALANDYESLEQISEILDSSGKLSQVKTALWTLIQEGYVACYVSTKMEMKPAAYPERRKLDAYWFALTQGGEQLLSVLNQEARD